MISACRLLNIFGWEMNFRRFSWARIFLADRQCHECSWEIEIEIATPLFSVVCSLFSVACLGENTGAPCFFEGNKGIKTLSKITVAPCFFRKS